MALQLKKVCLHGALAEQFGKFFNLAINTPLEALVALSAQLPKFRLEFAKYDYEVIKGPLTDGWFLDENTVKVQMGKFDEIHFIPVLKGSGGKKGIGKILVGIAMIGMAFTGVGIGWWGAAGLGYTSASWGVVGAMLLLGGVAEATSKTPKYKQDSVDRNESLIFNGAQNRSAQGNAIQLVYGRMRVGSQVISEGMTTVNI